MSDHRVLIFSPRGASALASSVGQSFSTDYCTNMGQVTSFLSRCAYHVVIMDAINSGELDLDLCEQLVKNELLENCPVIVFSTGDCLKERIKALEIGCDDLVDESVPSEEACARITRSIFHKIASEQLSGRLQQASKMAHTVMADNSHLGANIQFLISLHDCDNIDQLGQAFFAAMNRYGLKCSLQMRSLMGTKNMEASGMAKDLESQLLSELKDKGRYIDFGKRTIVNYDNISLLIKNMPVDDAEKYGSLKDNLFPLLQGLNARVYALEDQFKLNREQESLRQLSWEMTDAMASIKESYYKVMNDIVSGVESMAEAVAIKMPSFALTQADEDFLESVTANCVVKTNMILRDGIKLDETLSRLQESMQETIASVESYDRYAKEQRNNKADNADDGQLVELF